MKKILINSIIIFLLGFIVHNGYELFPCTIFSLFFPVNESLFEHIKVITTSYFIFYIFSKNTKTNKLITLIFNVILFYIIFLPIYYLFKHNIITTLIIYFISIFISQIIYNKIDKRINFIEKYYYILILIIILTIIYFTYYPIYNDFFIDINNKIGIYKLYK